MRAILTRTFAPSFGLFAAITGASSILRRADATAGGAFRATFTRACRGSTDRAFARIHHSLLLTFLLELIGLCVRIKSGRGRDPEICWYKAIEHHHKFSLEPLLGELRVQFGQGSAYGRLERCGKVDRQRGPPIRHCLGERGQKGAKPIRCFQDDKRRITAGKSCGCAAALLRFPRKEADELEPVHCITTGHQAGHDRADAGDDFGFDAQLTELAGEEIPRIGQHRKPGIGDHGDLLSLADQLYHLVARFILVMLVHLDQLLRDVIISEQAGGRLILLADHQIGHLQYMEGTEGDIITVPDGNADQGYGSGHLLGAHARFHLMQLVAILVGLVIILVDDPIWRDNL